MENKEYIVHVAVRPSLLRQINQRLGSKAPRGRYSSENTIFLTAPTNKFVGFQVGDLWGHHDAIASRHSEEHG